MLRHEQQSIRMALATVMHHSFKVHIEYGAPRSETTATRAREGEVREQHYGLRAQERPLPGTRPAPLLEVLPQVGAQRRTVDQIGDAVPGLTALDVPVPQMVENVTDTLLRILDFPVAEQVIEVPKISCSSCPSRSRVPEPQSAEQLVVEVPTVLSPRASLCRSRSRSSAFQFLRVLVANGVFKVFSQNRVQQRRLLLWNAFPERTVEQIVDIPSSGGGLRQESSSSAGAADEDFTGFFFFALFPKIKKCEVGSAPESEGARQCQLIHAGGSARIGLVVDVTHSCSAGRVGGGQGGSEEGAREQEEEEEEEEEETSSRLFMWIQVPASAPEAS